MEGDSPTTTDYNSALRNPYGHSQTTEEEEEEETSVTSLTSTLATASPSSPTPSAAPQSPRESRKSPCAIGPACGEISGPLTSWPVGSLPLPPVCDPPDWTYSQEGIILQKCERFRHSIAACRNCRQRTACCSCLLEMARGDPADNRCPSCFYF